MDINRIPSLQPYVARQLGNGALDEEERVKIENLILDERPTRAGVDLYASRIGATHVADLDDWHGRHTDFLKLEIQIGRSKTEDPWTFRPGNDSNRLRLMDHRQYLIRVEDVSWPCRLANITGEQLRDYLEKFHQGDSAAADSLEGFASRWNAERDKRPLFATTELEVGDIFEDEGNSSEWAERLRDRLGLGHYDPGYGGPIEIVAMRYTVQEVLDSMENNQGHPAIPTLLDGSMSQFFFPTPLPTEDGVAGAEYYGHTLNLSPVANESDYRMGVELLHPHIEYKPEHFFKMGVIARPVTMPLTQARRFHLPWLRLDYGRDDFGASILGVAS
ncbi:MAG: hypothetical protein ACYCTW_06160 [Sulfuricella sp.]